MLATDVLINKIKELGGVKNCLVVSNDGLVINSSLSKDEDFDKDFVSALIASIRNETEKNFKRLKIGEPKISIIETDNSVLSVANFIIENEFLTVYSEFKKDSNVVSILVSLKKIVKLFSK